MAPGNEEFSELLFAIRRKPQSVITLSLLCVCVPIRGVTIHNLYIVTFVSRYSDILYNTVKCELEIFPKL